MSATETKIRCPKCHGRFFVPLDEIGRDGTTPCPNCGTSIRAKPKTDAGVPAQKAPPAEAPPHDHVATHAVAPDAAMQPAAAGAGTAPARPWWKFWAR